MNHWKKRFAIAVVLAQLTAATAVADNFETAATAVDNMGVGWNLGNTLESISGQPMPDIVQAETYWGQPVTQPALMEMMRQAGFGAVRVPVTWQPHVDAAGTVDAAWMQRVHEVVDYVISQGLYCILNVHHDTGEDNKNYQSWLKADRTNYDVQKSRYEGLWQQIATEFRDYGERLLFEGYNEMLDSYSSWCFASYAAPGQYDAAVAASAYDAINSYAQSFVNTVRATGGNNAQRNLVVNTYGACGGAGSWNAHLKDPLRQMQLPSDRVAGHLIFQIHTYPDISNLNGAKAEMTDMFAALKTHLVAKGAPVIVGEWGTKDSYADYRDHRDKMLSFVTWFVQKAKAEGMSVFYWTGLTDGPARQLPAFSQPDLAETMVRAFWGDSFRGVFPTLSDYDVVYTVDYTGAWQELNLYADGRLDLSAYTALRLELEETPPAGTLQVKIYGDGKEGYHPLSTASSTMTLNASELGATVSRITLQYCKPASYSTRISSITLIRRDGTETELMPSVFWGCTLSLDAQLKRTGIRSVHAAKPPVDGGIYNLVGQRVALPRRGVYIRQGRKYVHASK